MPKKQINDPDSEENPARLVSEVFRAEAETWPEKNENETES